MNDKKKQQLQNANILRLAKSKAAIYFDCFDTLLIYKLSNLCVYKLFADYLIQNFYLEGSIERLGNSVMYMLKPDQSFNISVKNIYLHYRLDRFLNEDSFICQVSTAFLHILKINTAPREGMTDVLQSLKNAGKSVSVVSDYFLPSDLLRELIEHHYGREFISAVHSSSDYGVCKPNGLFKIVIGAPNQSLVIGDSLVSDVIAPRRIGADAMQLVLPRKVVDRYRQWDHNYNSSLSREIDRFRIRDKALWSSNFGYMLFDYSKRLYAQLEPGEIVYFLSREGQFMKKCFDLYLNAHNDKCVVSKYLMVSRGAVAMATYNNPRFGQFLHRFEYFNFEPGSLYEALICSGFDQCDVEYLAQKTGVDVKKQMTAITQKDIEVLNQAPSFVEVFAKKCMEARQKLLSLIEGKRGRIIVADVGWAGTMQDGLRDILQDISVDIYGYYIATHNRINEREKSHKRGLVSDYCSDPVLAMEPSKMGTLETLLRADHPQIVCYKAKGPDVFGKDLGIFTYKNYARPRQKLMEALFVELLNIDVSAPVSHEQLYPYEILTIEKKPRKARYLDLYYWNPKQPQAPDYLAYIRKRLKQRLFGLAGRVCRFLCKAEKT